MCGNGRILRVQGKWGIGRTIQHPGNEVINSNKSIKVGVFGDNVMILKREHIDAMDIHRSKRLQNQYIMVKTNVFRRNDFKMKWG